MSFSPLGPTLFTRNKASHQSIGPRELPEMRSASRQKLKTRQGEMRAKLTSIWNRVGLIVGLIFSLGIAQGFWSEASAQTLTTLHSFTGSDGTLPYSGLISDASGALYGTTAYGGLYGGGTVFKLAPPATAGGPGLRRSSTTSPPAMMAEFHLAG
jgi:uncharacterized repeat protein (TIGR03803 family)